MAGASSFSVENKEPGETAEAAEIMAPVETNDRLEIV
jgi:hypothetical protein